MRNGTKGRKTHGHVHNAKLLVPLFAVYILVACAPPEKPPVPREQTDLSPETLSGSNAMRRVESFVALGNRDAGTPGMLRAAKHVEAELLELDLKAEVDSFEVDTPHGPLVIRNVYSLLPGKTDALIVLVSHTDTKPGISDSFAGANDSASSTGLLLELAAHLAARQQNLQHSVLFAFVDGEECKYRYGPRDGLHGSRHLAAKLVDDGRAPRVKAVIVLDMIGDRDLQIRIPANCTPALVHAALEAAQTQGLSAYVGRSRKSILDDHVPFVEAGMPAVNLIDFTFGSAPGRNNYWHTPQDTLDKLSSESLAITGRTTLQLIEDLCNQNP